MVCLCTLTVRAQVPTMDSLLVAMPDTLIPLLSKAQRLDCCDFMKSKMRAVVTNNLGGKSELTALTADFALWQLTPSSRLVVKRLPVKEGGGCVLAVVHTVTAGFAMSDIAFYTADWVSLPAEDYLPASLLATEKGAWRSLQLDAEKNVLTVITEYDEINFSEEQEKAEVRPTVSLMFEWREGKFVAL